MCEKTKDDIVARMALVPRTLEARGLDATPLIQAKLRNDLKGLTYEFNAKGLVNHPNFMKWMGEAVRHEFEKS